MKSMEIGSGLHGTTMRGSATTTPSIRTSKVKCARRPTTAAASKAASPTEKTSLFASVQAGLTLMKPQASVNGMVKPSRWMAKDATTLRAAPAVPIVEAMALLVLADHWLINRAAKL